MTQPREEWQLPTQCVGRRVLVFDRLDSTNTRAAQIASDPANDGLALLADEQTAGRGQHGRTWTAPPRASVLLSVLLFPPPPLRRPAILTAWAAVSVCEVVRELTGVQARIKWPNDVLVRGRKVCGILMEQGQAVVAGIGLNVRQTAAHFAALDLPHAASLQQFVHEPLDPYDVARRLLHHLDVEYARLLAGDLGTLEACWKWHLGLLGRRVQAECLDGAREGRLLDLTFGGVVLEQDGQGPLCLEPERVVHVSEWR
jgi:BirA family biotin operon repressor/biotin-[acetyl-CoA-carboxylase] ligase